MLCEPRLSVVVAQVATPLPLSVAGLVQPARVAVPFLKVTVPLGVPAPGTTAVTVAVNVVDWPNTVGFTDELNAVPEVAWFTVWVTVFEVLVVKLASPA